MKNESKLTWKDVVKEALAEIGSSGHLDDINSQIEGHWKTKTNPTWKDTVRRTLQQYSIFYQEEKGSGIWFLREEKPLPEFDPKKNPNPAHEDVQGMLLELGKIYGPCHPCAPCSIAKSIAVFRYQAPQIYHS